MIRHLNKSLLKYPSLWRRNVFAAAPCLGPTGGIVVDHSPWHLRGTMTNMDPASDWVVENGQWAVDHTTNDYITFGNRSHTGVLSNFTVSLWFYARSTAGTQGIASHTSFSDGGWQIAINSGQLRFPKWNDNPSTAISANTLYHAAFVRRGAGAGVANEIWLNGRFVTSFAMADNGAAGYDMVFGRLYGGIDNFYLDGWWDDAMIWSRPLGADEIRLLSRRRGIAYEQRRRFLVAAVATGVSLTAGAGAGTGTGHAPSVMVGAEVAAGAGAGSGTGHAPDVSHGHVLSAGAGSGTGAGHAPSLNVGGAVMLTAGAGTGSGAGHAPSVVNGHALTAGVGSGTGVGYSTAPEIGAFISLGSGAGTGVGYAPTVTTGGAALTVSRRKLFLSGGLFV